VLLPLTGGGMGATIGAGLGAAIGAEVEFDA
jgi:thiamine pyrophosphate-dependent acetolactate synthase large subunit-like protein